MNTRKKVLGYAVAAALSATALTTVATPKNSIPSVVVTVENSAPSRGAFQTPFWIGAHDGSFNIYNRGDILGENGTVAAPAVERLAEDGATGPISDAFATSNYGSPQATVVGPSGPFAPGDRASFTLNVDPQTDRYFSYASMVIPSNDAFIANGNPLAHPLFNAKGRFVAKNFVVAGSEVLDAGTEVNDEIAANTAFLNQGGPDIGDSENNGVVLHPGLLAPGSVSYPDGVLNHPALGLADFTSPTYRAAGFSFRYVDLGSRLKYSARMRSGNEVTGSQVDSRGRGYAVAVSKNGEELRISLQWRRLTGPAVALHLHNAQAGANGPVVVNLTEDIKGNSLLAKITAEDVVGPLAEGDRPMVNLLNELVAGNIYINLHTEANPGGEIRGQLRLSKR